MDWPAIDLIIRSVAISLLLLLSIILWRDYRNALPARLGILIIVGVISYFIFEIPSVNRNITLINVIICAFESSIYSMFWIFARSWFNDETHINWKSWLVIALTTSISVIIWAMQNSGADNNITIPTRLMWLAFVLWGLWIAWRGHDNDLVEARRNLRIVFIGITGIPIAIITIIYFIYNIFLNEYNVYILVISVNTIIVVITYFLIMSIIRAHPADLFAPSQKKDMDHKGIDLEAQNALRKKLDHYITYERAYRDEGLTIAALANMLGEQEYRLRRFINGHLGYRNFSAFLNHYRLEEVKQALADPDQKDVPILTIAMDAGFGSLAPFNRAFRQTEGITPTQYRKAQYNKI